MALALGALRAGLLRSGVTTLSVALAIAFLAYTALSQRLAGNLVVLLHQLEKAEPVSADALGQAAAALVDTDLVDPMSRPQRLKLARRLRLHEVEPAVSELERIESELDRLQGPSRGTGEPDQQQGPGTFRLLQGRLGRSTARINELEGQIRLGRWLAGGGHGDQMDRQLAAALAGRYRHLTEQFAQHGDLPDVALADLDHLVARLQLQALPGDAGHLQTMLAAIGIERQRRAAARLRMQLRRHGVSADQTTGRRTQQTWLIVMALMTCAVGITNAMLMSVTERFRQIGTMKCLGATDSLIIKLFLVESAMLGVFGTAIGLVLGVAVAFAAGLIQFGSLAAGQFPFLAGWAILLKALACGVGLAVAGTVYPALVASRMRPVDALRVDE